MVLLIQALTHPTPSLDSRQRHLSKTLSSLFTTFKTPSLVHLLQGPSWSPCLLLHPHLSLLCSRHNCFQFAGWATLLGSLPKCKSNYEPSLCLDAPSRCLMLSPLLFNLLIWACFPGIVSDAFFPPWEVSFIFLSWLRDGIFLILLGFPEYLHQNI